MKNADYDQRSLSGSILDVLDFPRTTSSVRQAWYNSGTLYQTTWQNGYETPNDPTSTVFPHTLPVHDRALCLGPISLPHAELQPTDTSSISRPSPNRSSSPPPPLSPALTSTSPLRVSPQPLSPSSPRIPPHTSMPQAPDPKPCRTSTRTGA